jgi:DNA invertase Pin-like site-specific DNA recombinase/IS30 family transposase
MTVVDASRTPASVPNPVSEQQKPESDEAICYGRQKIEARHIERLAIVYVRQSDPQQVIRHRESTALQYSLIDRAVHLGWPRERVLVIDEDQGISGQHAEGRLGFQRMMAEVAMNHVGIILGREMSRLARSCKDWYQLLEVCGLFDTILSDQDGVYDPATYHDRLLLGLTGIMSEAELHVMRGRLHAGLMNKARRGELFNQLPLGYVRLSTGGVALDPDEQVQAVVRLVFEKFDELGSVNGVLRYLAKHTIRFGIRPHGGRNRGQLEWRRPNQATIRNVLHHPMYAGAYVYGRRKIDPRGKVPGRPATGLRNRPREQWAVLLKDRHPAYITWEQFEANQRKLAENRARSGNLGAPREGSSLLGGLLVCGKCGCRMVVTYAGKKTALSYLCRRQCDCYGQDPCQKVAGKVLDELVTRQALRVLEPASLELSLAAADDIERERARLAQHWTQRRERARYEVERAARQYHAVEPQNRLVARELERNWEQALLEHRRAEEDFERFQRSQPTVLTESDRQLIKSLATQIPKLWNSQAVTPPERQTILRHLIDRVVVEVEGHTEIVDVTIQWAGGFASQHEVVRPVRRYEQLHDFDRLKSKILELHQAGWTSRKIAQQLNQEGFRPPRRAKRYNKELVRQILSRSIQKSPKSEKTAAPSNALGPDEWLLRDLARSMPIPEETLYAWLRRGWVTGWKVSVGRRRSQWIVWADSDERDRLRRLRACPLGKCKTDQAPELTIPKARPAR